VGRFDVRDVAAEPYTSEGGAVLYRLYKCTANSEQGMLEAMLPDAKISALRELQPQAVQPEYQTPCVISSAFDAGRASSFVPTIRPGLT
jgi:hypothetical protein